MSQSQDCSFPCLPLPNINEPGTPSNNEEAIPLRIFFLRNWKEKRLHKQDLCTNRHYHGILAILEVHGEVTTNIRDSFLIIYMLPLLFDLQVTRMRNGQGSEEGKKNIGSNFFFALAKTLNFLLSCFNYLLYCQKLAGWAQY